MESEMKQDPDRSEAKVPINENDQEAHGFGDKPDKKNDLDDKQELGNDIYGN